MKSKEISDAVTPTSSSGAKMITPSSPTMWWKKRLKRLLVAAGLHESAHRILRRAWSRTDWLLYHHTYDVVPGPCPGDDLSLQEVSRSDVSLINEMVQTRQPELSSFDEKRFASQLLQGLSNGQRCFVARAGGEIAGWLRLSPIDTEIWKSGVVLKPGAKELKDLFITLKYRGSGVIAYFLLVELLLEAQRMGVPELTSVISPDNLPSIRMNTMVGFRQMGTMLKRRRFFYRTFSFHQAAGV